MLCGKRKICRCQAARRVSETAPIPPCETPATPCRQTAPPVHSLRPTEEDLGPFGPNLDKHAHLVTLHQKPAFAQKLDIHSRHELPADTKVRGPTPRLKRIFDLPAISSSQPNDPPAYRTIRQPPISRETSAVRFPTRRVVLLGPKKRPQSDRVRPSCWTWTVVRVSRRQPGSQVRVGVISACPRINNDCDAVEPNRQVQCVEMTMSCGREIAERRKVPPEPPQS
jgi:hypothetical protein